MVEFLGLTSRDLEYLQKLFIKMDNDGSGAIDTDEFFSYTEVMNLECTNTSRK